MRQLNSASCKNNCLPAVYRAILLLLASWTLMPNAVTAQTLTVLHEAEYLISDSISLPANNFLWSKVLLPHRSTRPTGQDLTAYWYRLTFDFVWLLRIIGQSLVGAPAIRLRTPQETNSS